MKFWLLGFASFLTLAPAHVCALGIRIADQNAWATARGNAFVATAENAAAIYYNPAGITQLQGQNALLGVYGIHLESEYVAPDGTRTRSTDDLHFTPQLFYSITPENSPAAFGLGFYTPYGLGFEWPDNPVFRAGEGSIQYFTLNPVAALELHPTLSAAVGLTLNYADAEFQQTLLPHALFPPGGEVRFEGDGTDVGVNLGLLWRPHEQHAFGISYRSRTRIDLRGDSRTSGADLAGIPSRSESASADFTFPHHIVIGWSYRPTPRWNLEINVDWTDWEALDAVVIKQDSGRTPLPFHWNSSFFYEFGVTRFFDGGWRLSGGYIFSENSVPDDSFNPLVPDSDRHIFSLGVGRQYDRFHWDLAYQFAYGPEREVEGSRLTFPVGATADGRYEFLSHAIAFSIGCAF